MSDNFERRQGDGTIGALAFAWVVDLGSVREANEDAVSVTTIPWWNESAALVIAVADGLGGEGGGGPAAQRAVDDIAALAEQWRAEGAPAEWDAVHRALTEAFRSIDRNIRDDARMEERRPGATTLVAAVVASDGFAHAYTGDSRLYHLSAANEPYRTRDQTLAQVYLDAGRIKSEAEATPRQRNTLFGSLGGDPGELSIEPEWETVAGDDGPVSAPIDDQPAIRRLTPGDRLIVCTDGLWGALPPESLSAIFRESADDTASLRDRLVQAALDAGGPDNIGIVTVRVGDVASK